jgi:hypothetical protein
MQNTLIKILSLSLSAIWISVSAYASHPSIQDHPGEIFFGESSFAKLINEQAEGRPANAAWAGYWWPYTGNGTASDTYGGGNPRAGEGRQSPVGKYDAARGGTTYAQKWEWKNHGASIPQLQGWWGHDEGWSNASALFSEPREAVKINGIEFGVADIKALLSEACMEVDADYYGNRVEPGNANVSKRWDDVVPDQFFLVLTNAMGARKQSIVIDSYTGVQTWNQSIAGYRFYYPKPEDYLGATRSAPGIYRLNLKATIWWANDSGVPADVLTPEFNFSNAYVNGAEVIQHRDLKMELWLDGPVVFDKHGKIVSSGDVIQTQDGTYVVGGVWHMGSGNVEAQPDTMYVPHGCVKSRGDSNPEVDLGWIQKHLLTPSRANGPSVEPAPIVPGIES